MSGPNPRAAAVSALVKQEQNGFSNLVLDAELKRQQLEGRDKAFASAIFYTVLEHRGTLDYMLGQFLPKGLARLDAPVREILRSALAQARYMQVPASAAVNEAVKLTRAFRKSSAAGLVNAVLRRACTYDLSTARFRNETERLMVLGSHPLPGRGAGHPDLCGRRRQDQPAGQPAQGRCRHPLRKAGGAGCSGRAGPCAGQCAGRI